MMHVLEVPFPLARFEIDADQRIPEQIVAGPVAAIDVLGGIFDRQIDEAEVLVDRNLRPHAGIAVDGPRLVLPGVVAELAGTRNRVERPEQLAGLHVERADEPFRVVVRDDRHPFLERRPDDDHVLDDGGRRVQPDFTGFEIDRLALAEHRALLQIDDAVLAERRNHGAVLRIELDQAVARRHVQDALVALAVGPVGDAAAGELPRRDRRAVALTVAVRPDQLARFAVERDDRPPRSRRRVEHASDRERRPFELELGTRAEVVGLEPPGDLQLVEVRRVDLIERRVLRPVHVGGVMRPVAVFGAGEVALARRAHRHPGDAERQRGQRQRGTPECSRHRFFSPRVDVV